MRDTPNEPIPFPKKAVMTLEGNEPYKDLKQRLKAEAEKEYKLQKAEAERELKAYLARQKAEAEGKYLNGRLILLWQRCADLGILEQFRRKLEQARKEEDHAKLNRKLNRIEKAVISIEEEARIRQQFPYNLGRFFDALEEIARMSRNRTSTHENEYLTQTVWYKHFPWEEGSNKLEAETIRFDYCGEGPEWVEKEWEEWERQQREKYANQSKATVKH